MSTVTVFPDKKLSLTLLTDYEFCPEVYRQKCRKLTKLSSETHSDFAFRLTTAFQRWLHSVNAYDNIKGVISTGQTRLRFGSVWFSSVHFGHMRGQNHVRFTLVQYGVC